MVPFETLRQTAFFEELSDTMLQRLSAIAKLKLFSKGVFFSNGKAKTTSARYFYIVLEGDISLQIESLTGKTIRLETIAPGAAIGFSSLIEMKKKRYVSDAKTLTKVKVLRFSADEMMMLFYQDFEMGFLVMKKIALIAKRRLVYRTYPIPSV